MAVDTHCWAQSRARWPLRTIPAPTPVTPGVSGGSECQRGERCDFCLGISTLRAVRAAGMALSWSQTRAENPVWVSSFTGVFFKCIWCLITLQKCSSADRLFMFHVITDVLPAVTVEYTQGMPFLWHIDRRGKPIFATDTCSFSNQVYKVVSWGHKSLTRHQNEGWEIQDLFLLCLLSESSQPDSWFLFSFLCWEGVLTCSACGSALYYAVVGMEDKHDSITLYWLKSSTSVDICWQSDGQYFTTQECNLLLVQASVSGFPWVFEILEN